MKTCSQDIINGKKLFETYHSNYEKSDNNKKKDYEALKKRVENGKKLLNSKGFKF